MNYEEDIDGEELGPKKEVHFEETNNNLGRPKRLLRKGTTKNFLAESFFGWSTDKEAKRFFDLFFSHQSSMRQKVPEGFVLAYSKSGHPYLERIPTGEQGEYDAYYEHRRSKLPLGSPLSKIQDKFGVGMYLYFDFVKYLIYNNILLTILGIISEAFHFHENGLDFSQTRNDSAAAHIEAFYRNFYISYYTTDVKTVWYVTTIVSAALWFFFGPYYSVKVVRYFDQQGLTDYENEFDDDDTITENRHVTKRARILRGVISMLLTLVCLGISAFLTFFLVIVSENILGTISGAIAVALLLQTIHMFWRRVCILLTTFEQHKHWSTYRKTNTFKFFVFKMCNVLLIYILRYFIRERYKRQFQYNVPFVHEQSRFREDICGIDEISDQFLYLMVSEIFLANTVSVIIPWLRWIWRRRKAEKGKFGNNHARPEFDIAVEYLDLFYRQFIIYLGMSVFPLIAVLGVVANLVKYWLDKYKLLRICREPAGSKLEGSMRKFVVFYLFTMAICAIASFPHGTLWILAGFNFKHKCGPSVYSN